MEDNLNLKIIATIKTDFPTKFGVPRQSGLIPQLKGKIVFEPEYREEAALRGLDGYSHLWIIWKFSEAVSEKWSPTVRPPRLGGNKRMGVFATRSPFRPNPIGLSSVKIERIYNDSKDGPVIEVLGADLMDGTPIYDIKPYIAYTDSHPNAIGGFSTDVFDKKLNVIFECDESQKITPDFKKTLTEILANDPRPGYQEDANRIYSFEYSDYIIKFSVNNENVKVISVEEIK